MLNALAYAEVEYNSETSLPQDHIAVLANLLRHRAEVMILTSDATVYAKDAQLFEMRRGARAEWSKKSIDK